MYLRTVFRSIPCSSAIRLMLSPSSKKALRIPWTLAIVSILLWVPLFVLVVLHEE